MFAAVAAAWPWNSSTFVARPPSPDPPTATKSHRRRVLSPIIHIRPKIDFPLLSPWRGSVACGPSPDDPNAVYVSIPKQEPNPPFRSCVTQLGRLDKKRGESAPRKERFTGAGGKEECHRQVGKSNLLNSASKLGPNPSNDPKRGSGRVETKNRERAPRIWRATTGEGVGRYRRQKKRAFPTRRPHGGGFVTTAGKARGEDGSGLSAFPARAEVGGRETGSG